MSSLEFLTETETHADGKNLHRGHKFKATGSHIGTIFSTFSDVKLRSLPPARVCVPMESRMMT